MTLPGWLERTWLGQWLLHWQRNKEQVKQAKERFVQRHAKAVQRLVSASDDHIRESERAERVARQAIERLRETQEHFEDRDEAH